MGCLLLLAFLALGMAAAWRLLPGACVQVRLWLGAAGGMMAMMWLPSLFAFFLDFTAQAQYMALAAGAVLWGLCMLPWRRLWTACARLAHGAWGAGPAACGQMRSEGAPDPGQAGRWADLSRSAGRALAPAEEAAPGPPLALTLGLVLPFLALAAYLQYTHTLREIDGALYVGQSTYGDLCLHLGIATGLRGASYPPEYTLLPGVLLGYPFLFDALSASMLVLGCPLALSFTLPGTIAMGLVFWGFVLLAWEMTQDALAVALAYLLAFLNGGLGFAYMLDGWPTDSTMLREIFTGYYQTPTNMPDLNLRWVNVICDMMIPQRTLLGGWMALLPALYMLCRGIKTRAWGWFAALGVWVGAMPMVHTHSFLALGLISLGLFAWEMACCRRGAKNPAGAPLSRVLGQYLLYGGLALALALPQLLTWTFPQSLSSGQLGWRFNWVNTRDDGSFIDGYFWFWIKNVGPVYLLMLPAALNAPPKLKGLCLGALLVYAAAELYQFQPNVYDNNKLFYVAFLLMLPLVGRLLSALWRAVRRIRGRWLLALPLLAVCLLSGSLSLCREALSQYQLFSREEARAAAYIDENAPEDALFLTGGQHNNPVSSLAGRSLVCGTPTYLYFHGVDYSRQQADVARMYEDPLGNLDLFQQYGVDYIYISSYERASYDLDQQTLTSLFPLWYQDGFVTILEVAGQPEGQLQDQVQDQD